MSRISISEPWLPGREAEYVLDCVQRGRLSAGDYVRRFEELIAQQAGCRYATATMNGTAALHAAVLALGLRAGDEVLVPATTYIATANAVRYCGAKPVIVDVRHDTWTLDWSRAEESLTRRTVGAIPVHLYGVPAEVPGWASGRLWVLEDAAEAHGARFPTGQPVGSRGRAGVFSYYGNKILTCGEGGAVVTGDSDVAAVVRRVRGQGQSLTRRYVHTSLGHNYRMTELQAAVGLAQAERLAQHVSRRRIIGDIYRSRLRSEAMQAHPDGAVDWVMPVFVGDAEAVGAVLAREGIETRPVFPPLHRQPIYQAPVIAPVSEMLHRSALLLPLHAQMTADDVHRVCDALAAAVRSKEEVMAC